MSDTFRRILGLIQRKEVRVSDHGYDELMEEDISQETFYLESDRPRSSKITRNIRRDLVALYCRMILAENRYTSLGEFHGEPRPLLYW